MKRLLPAFFLLAAATAAHAQIATGSATPRSGGGNSVFPEQFANPLPGLWQCRNGEISSMRRELGPAMGFVSGAYTSPIDGVTTTWAEKDSWTYTGEMYLTAGTTYTFATRIDDYATITIDEIQILNQGGCSFTTGKYACRTTGWHNISIKIWDTGGGYGVCGGFTPGVAFNTTGQTTQTPLNGWTRLIDSGNGSLLRTRGPTSGVFVSAQMRETDPTVMDVDYIVYTDPATTPMVNVRALAFEDGERSFAKVVRPETFIEGTNANIGDGIVANVAHRLSWKVSSDWATDLAKVSFEVMVMRPGNQLLPDMHFVTIPATDEYPALKVSVNQMTPQQVFDALMWLYADNDPEMTLVDGTLMTNLRFEGGNVYNGKTWLSSERHESDHNGIVYAEGCSKEIYNKWYYGRTYYSLNATAYVLHKMGYRFMPRESPILSYVRRETRFSLELVSRMTTNLIPNIDIGMDGVVQYAVKTVEE